MAVKQKYYSLNKILEYNAHYNLLIGERSNGKTFACLEYGIRKYIESCEQMAIVRRWNDDFKGKRASVMFDSLIDAGIITKYSKGEWTGVEFKSGRWYLMRIEEEKKIVDETPFAYAFSLSAVEHDKSTSYPNITTVFFDEFLTRQYYLPNEFILFMNVLSTIIRDRNNVKIFMAGNTVNQYSPYYVEFGLKNIKKMKKGDIDIYKYGDSGLTLAVEFTDNPQKKKKSDFYFAFDNPALDMITGKNSVWEMDIYPHLPMKYAPKDVKFIYFIIFDNEILQCEIIYLNKCLFTYIHRKTTELQNPDKDLIFSPMSDPRPNWQKSIIHPTSNYAREIAKTFNTDSVFYQDNEVGEIVNNYLKTLVH